MIHNYARVGARRVSAGQSLGTAQLVYGHRCGMEKRIIQSCFRHHNKHQYGEIKNAKGSSDY